MSARSRNTGQTRGSLNRLRDGSEGGDTMAYHDEGAIPLAVRGDQDGPWIKGPPFTTDRDELYSNATIPLASAGYVFTPAISVRDWRVLTLFITYIVGAGDDNDQLSLIPEFSMDDDGDLFYPIGVVEAAVTQVNLAPAVIPFEPPFGSRTFYPTELRTPQMAAGDDLHVSLTFDVGAYNRYRFGLASLLAEGDGGNLVLSYSLSM